MIDSIICEVSSWVILNPPFKDCSLTDMVRDWITCISASPTHRVSPNLVWMPPCEGKIKMNFDGTLAGYGCVMRDSHRSIILVKDGSLGTCDANYTETIDFSEAVKMLKAGGNNGCYVEGDSMIALGWGRGQTRGSWRIHHFIEEIKVLAKEISATLIHVPRCQNDMANRVAKCSASSQMDFLGEHMPE